MAGLPSTYQQVLKNMKQIEEDHTLLSDPTNGLVAVATKVNHPTNGIDKINSRLNNSTTGLEVIAGKVNNPTTGIAALNNKLDNTVDRVGDLENDVGVIEKYAAIPEGLTIDPSTGVMRDADGNIVQPPEFSFGEVVDIVDDLKDMFLDNTLTDESAVKKTDDGVTKVAGVHTHTVNNTSIGAPSTYKYGVTYEIKKITSIFSTAISNRPEFSGETYCLVATYTIDSKLHNESAVSTFNTFNPFQIAFCPKSGNYFKRFAQTLSDSWGTWTTSIRTMEEMAVVSANEPTTQLTGEFWYETGIGN